MKYSLSANYNKMSYRGKFKTLFNFVLFLTILFIIILSFFFTRLLSNEIYDRNQEKLTVLSLSIEQNLSGIEKIVTEIHQNSELQKSIINLNNDSISTLEKSTMLNAIRKEINWLLADKSNVEGVKLMNNSNELILGSIYDDKNFFDNKSLSDILETLPPDSKNGHWIFSKNLDDAIFLQNIYSTREETFLPIATVIISVDSTFLGAVLENERLFSQDDFFVLDYNGEFYSTDEIKRTEYTSFLTEKSEKKYQQNSDYFDFSSKTYYVFSNTLTVGNDNLHIYFFLINMQVIKSVIKITIAVLLIVLFVTFLGVIAVDYFINKLLKPINNLVESMENFRGESDLSSLKAISKPLTLYKREDEIGILYQSFQRMIQQIEELIIKDYQSKLLRKDSEYKFLQAQLDPHFLYNTLNSINWLAINKGDFEISEMITSLAFLFREKIDKGNEFEPISRELDIVNAYIHIQLVRFNSRLDFNIEIEDTSYLDFRIPKLIIQPIIENSIKYAVEKVNKKITVTLRIQIKSDFLIISVEDNGPGFQDEKIKNKNSIGLGLENIESRLKIIYGDQAKLKISSTSFKSTIVSLIIPLEKIKESKND